jgi:hypothetical protein
MDTFFEATDPFLTEVLRFHTEVYTVGAKITMRINHTFVDENDNACKYSLDYNCEGTNIQ